MKVRWTDTARRHLREIHTHIRKDSPHYARQMVDRLTRRSAQIGAFPESGREVPEIDRPDVREVFEGPYRVIYRILDDRIDVLAVVHGARLLTPRLLR